MNIFKSYTYTWWQIGIFKLALLTIGALIGANWDEFVGNNQTLIVVVAVVATVYIMFVSLKQNKR